MMNRQVGKVGIGGLQLDAASTLVQAFEGEFTVYDGYDDMAVPGLQRAIDDDVVAIVDARIPHGKTTRAHEIGGIGLTDEQGANVQALEAMVFGRAGETALNGGGDRP